MSKRLIFTFIALIMTTMHTRAQDTTAPCDSAPWNITFRHYLMGGADWIRVNDLNSSMTSLGLKHFSSSNFSLTWGWDMLYNRLMSGGEIGGLFQRPNVSGNTHASFWAARLLFNTGFQLLPSRTIYLYPVVGIGVGVSFLSIGPDQVTFTQALSTPNSSLDIHQFSFAVNLGGGFDYALPVWRNHSGMLVGVRGGYMVDPTRSSKWYRDMTTITNGPDPVLQGPYVRLLLGKNIQWRINRVGSKSCDAHSGM